MSRPAVEAKFSDCPEAAVGEGAEELTPPRGEEGGLRTFIDTTKVGDCRWGPSLVHEDWHAICQAIFKGIEGEEWERLFLEYVETQFGQHSPSEQQPQGQDLVDCGG